MSDSTVLFFVFLSLAVIGAAMTLALVQAGKRGTWRHDCPFDESGEIDIDTHERCPYCGASND